MNVPPAAGAAAPIIPANLNLKLAEFDATNVAHWLRTNDFCFSVNDQYTPHVRYIITLKCLPTKVSLDLSDVTDAHTALGAGIDWGVAYNELKAALVARHADTNRAAIKKLLKEEKYDDEKPTIFLRRLKSIIAGRNLQCDDILREQFLQSMPGQIQASLATDADKTLDQIAEKADLIYEIIRDNLRRTVSQVSSQALAGQGSFGSLSSLPAAQNPSGSFQSTLSADPNVAFLINAISSLTQTVKELKSQVDAGVTTRGRSKKKRGDKEDSESEEEEDEEEEKKEKKKKKKEKGSTYRGRSGSRRRSNRGKINPDMCWYHEKFGVAAHRCEHPCVWRAPPGAAAVNAAVGGGNAASGSKPATYSLPELTALMASMRSAVAPDAGN
jgi:hypothetical protein